LITELTNAIFVPNLKKMKNKQTFVLAIALVIIAALSRLVSHPMNFTPITALILFSVYAFEGKWKLIIPITAILMSDLFLEINTGTGFHSGTWLIYSAYVVMGIIGYLIIKKESAVQILLGSVSASVSFFLLTNFALFYPEITTSNGLQGYSHNWAGIIASYTAGIPFFRNMLLGDVIYTAVLFGALVLIKKTAPKLNWLNN
jgi:hypothetical protein